MGKFNSIFLFLNTNIFHRRILQDLSNFLNMVSHTEGNDFKIRWMLMHYIYGLHTDGTAGT